MPKGVLPRNALIQVPVCISVQALVTPGFSPCEIFDGSFAGLRPVLYEEFFEILFQGEFRMVLAQPLKVSA